MTWKGKSFISVIVFSGDFISMSPAPWCIIQDYTFSLSWCLEHAETTLHGSKLIYADLSFIRAQYLACESGVNNPRQTPGIIARSLQKIWTSDVFSTSSQPLAFFSVLWLGLLCLLVQYEQPCYPKSRHLPCCDATWVIVVLVSSFNIRGLNIFQS